MGKKQRGENQPIKVLYCFLQNDKDNEELYLQSNADGTEKWLQTFIKNQTKEPNQQKYQILINFYLSAPYKHPIKKTLARILNNLNADIIIECIIKAIQWVLKGSILSQFSLVINSCNDTLRPSIPALSNSKLLVEIGKEMPELLRKCYELLRNEDNRAESLKKRNVEIHDFSQACILFLGKCDRGMHAQWFSISRSIFQMMDVENMIYDTRNNFGIMFIYCIRLADPGDKLSQVFLAILDNAVKDPEYTFLNNMKIKNKIAIINGVLNACNPIFLNDPRYNIAITLPDFKTWTDSSIVLVLLSYLFQISYRRLPTEELVMISRNVLLISRKFFPDSNEVIDMLRELFRFVKRDIEHNIDTVRHQTKQLLVNMIKYSKNDPKALSFIVETIYDMKPVFLSSFMTCVSILSQESPDTYISFDPNVGGYILDNRIRNAANNPQVLATYISFLKYSKLNFDEWHKKWVCPLFKEITNQTIEEYRDNGIYLITEAIKVRPELSIAVINEIDEKATDDWKEMILFSAKVARKYGHKLPDDKSHKDGKPKWRGLISFEYLKKACYSLNPKIQIGVIEALAESPKTTESLEGDECTLILHFIDVCLNCVHPADRQQISASMKKIFNRIKLSTLNFQRRIFDAERYDFGSSTFKQLAEEIMPIQINYIDKYTEFLSKLRNQLIEKHLFPGANFYRRNLSLQILTEFNAIQFQEAIAFHHIKEFNSKQANSLFFCLADSYEINKKLAVAILREYPIEFIEPLSNPELYLTKCFKLAASNRPADSITGAYMLDLGLNHQVIQNLLKDYGKTDCPIYNAIWKLFSQLRDEFRKTKSMGIIGNDGAMYGCIFMIRHLFEQITEIKIQSLPMEWRDLIHETIELSFEVTNLVAPIVNNASPEGYIPTNNQSDDNSIHPQSILLCAWRSIKEISLLFGAICTQAKLVSPGSEYGLITEKHILSIGYFFINTLSETKHRGAFEQASVGFTQLCKRLWSESHEELKELPETWLNEIIGMLTNQEELQNKKFCATRRSAGLPFMVQAIEITEFDVFDKSFTFDSTMKTLLKIGNPKKTNNAECCTHALNILRALFKHTALTDHCSLYLADAVMIAIDGADHPLWGVHNGSSLLFATLMSKIFGVTRTKIHEELSSRNQMSAHTFFTRYPVLYNFLLEHLKSCDFTRDMQTKPSLYPILLLLGRLFPSSYQVETEYKIASFIPYLNTCSTHNPVFKTRVLAVKALIPLINKERLVGHAVETIRELRQLDKSRGGNYYHGKILQVYHILKSPTTFGHYLLLLDEIVNEPWIPTDRNLIIQEIYVKILQFLMLKLKTKAGFYVNAITELKQSLTDPKALNYLNFREAYDKLVIYHSIIFHDTETKDTNGEKLQISVSVEDDFFADVVLYAKYRGSYIIEDLIDENLFPNIKVDYESLFKKLVKDIPDFLKKNNYLIEKDDFDERAKMNLLLSCLEPDVMEDIVGEANLVPYFLTKLSEEVLDGQCYVAKCLHNYLESSKIWHQEDESDTRELLSLYIFKYSSPGVSYKHRRAVAELLGKVQEIWRIQDIFLGLEDECMYSCRMIAGFIKLLNDNDESIRGMSTFEVSTADSNCYLLPQFDLFCKYLEPRLKKDMYLKFLLYWIFREPTYQNEEELLDTGLFEKGEENAFIEETALAQMAVERIKILMNLPGDNGFIAHLIKNKLMDTMAAWGPTISTGKLQKISDLLKSGNKFETDLLTTDIFDLKVKLLLEIL